MDAFMNTLLWIVAVICCIVALGGFVNGMYDVTVMMLCIAAGLILISKL